MPRNDVDRVSIQRHLKGKVEEFCLDSNNWSGSETQADVEQAFKFWLWGNEKPEPT